MTLRDRFDFTSQKNPMRIAAQEGRQALTYRALRQKAMRWASNFRSDMNTEKKIRVAVVGSRGLDSYTAILASLYSGGAYVPINIKNPPCRLRAIFEQCRPDVVVFDRSGLRLLTELIADFSKDQTVVVPSAPTELIASLRASAVCRVLDSEDLQESSPFSAPPLTADDVAYIMFTSGSTGVPKGVPIQHRQTNAFFESLSQVLELNAQDRLSQTFDLSFDLSVFDLFAAWSVGAAVVTASDTDLLAPVQYVREQKITVWFSVPSLAAHAVGTIRHRALPLSVMPTLRLSLFCGEALRRKTADAWFRLCPQSRILNLYGPTEATIACSSFLYEPSLPSFQESVSIGKPFRGTEFLLLDDEGEAVPSSVPGHLYIGGVQVFDGYLSSTVTSPFIVYEGRRYYRSGDLARREVNGDFTFMGRADSQVKIRGYRIELGEIESAYLRQPEVENVVVVPHPDLGELTAFVKTSLDLRALKTRITAHLPAYMVPQNQVPVDEFPLNANRKIDRNQLSRVLERSLSCTHSGKIV